MTYFTKLSLSLLIACCLISLTGCSGSSSTTTTTKSTTTHSDDHDHDDDDHEEGEAHADDDDHGHEEGEHKHPETYDEGVAELAEMHKTIKAGFEGDDADAGHGPLHDVGHLLGDIEKLVEKSDMSDEVKKEVLAAIDTLFGAYGAVDDKLHGEEGKDYSEVSADVDAAMKTLQDNLSKKDAE